MVKKMASRKDTDGTGKGGECEYYPCHFEGQDCTWCFCPFYPCLDERAGGEYVTSKRTGKEVWSCKGCRWVHDEKVAKEISKEISGVKEKMMNLLPEND
jgi:Zn-finger protein